MDLARQVSIKVLFMENGLAAETAPSAPFLYPSAAAVFPGIYSFRAELLKQTQVRIENAYFYRHSCFFLL